MGGEFTNPNQDGINQNGFDNHRRRGFLFPKPKVARGRGRCWARRCARPKTNLRLQCIETQNPAILRLPPLKPWPG